MRLTPLEIRQKTFEKGFRGYEKEDVDAYLLSLSAEWERLIEMNREQKTRIEMLERDVQKMREVEVSLYKTLKTAEDTGTHVVEQANKTAELLLKEAQMNADAILNDSKYKAKNLVEEAELKARNIEEDAKDAVKMAMRELDDIQRIKDDLLQELKNAANNTLERVEKLSVKNKRNTHPINKDTEQENAPSLDTQKSFFDTL